jgi:hypothetical protein
MSFFSFLDEIDQPTDQPTSQPTQSKSLSVREVRNQKLAQANALKNAQYWDKKSFCEVGIIRGERVSVRIDPYGFRGDETIAKISYRITPSNFRGDQEYGEAIQWQEIGRIANKKQRLVFFIDPSSEALPIGFLTIIKHALKSIGLVHTDNLKLIRDKDKKDIPHPFLDPRLHSLLRIVIISGKDYTKPFEFSRDMREVNSCQNMQPDSAISTYRDSKRSKRQLKIAENRIAVLEKQNRELAKSLDQVKPENVTVDPDTGMIVDRWFKVSNDLQLNHTSKRVSSGSLSCRIDHR